MIDEVTFIIILGIWWPPGSCSIRFSYCTKRHKRIAKKQAYNDYHLRGVVYNCAPGMYVYQIHFLDFSFNIMFQHLLANRK